MTIQRNDTPPANRPEIEDKVANYLQAEGYHVTKAAKITGQSGVAHVFDMLAEADDFLIHNKIVISFALNSGKDLLGSLIFNFSKQAYDAGINQRILVSDEEIDKKVKELARQKRVRILDIKQIESLIKTSAPKPFPVPAKEKPVIESKEQLLTSS